MKNRLNKCVLMLLGVLLAFWVGGSALAQPSEVVIGTYINKIEDLNFRENKYTIDFYVWFRWKAEGPLADYNPIENFEIMNGKIESKTGLYEKKIDDLNYATVRVSARISEPWNLTHFPFDSHTITVSIEDSAYDANTVVFVADKKNSNLGDEIKIAGWSVSNFVAEVMNKVYNTNLGDSSLPSDAQANFSRFMFTMDIDRTSLGLALKLLSTVLLATAVAFVTFMVKPSHLDARFGMGVGSLFAVAASAFISASLVPDSGDMTTSDKMHIVALAFIFFTLLMSTVCLKFDATGREKVAYKIDCCCLVLLPLLFYGWVLWEFWRSYQWD